ncbi:ephrin-B2-like [Xenia sp. Carnegie-2017]|uniref:ephrin-B2-like n=1 Tax=Xenia sp. Carnegie-2017 TaxID=2897299 RepID=UPI001F0462C7|nr:ephrin-B2-like [Xenia sp. Carnegie-2017]
MDGRYSFRRFIILFCCPSYVILTHYPTVFWTTNNCRFNLNKNGQEGYKINVKAMSNMIFMCPHISLWAGKTDDNPTRSMMYSNVLLVDRESYMSCDIKNESNVKELLTCKKDPMGKEVDFVKQTFASRHADSTKHPYHGGNHYYFISTSNGSLDSIHNRNGGYCRTHHMKLVIYVCKDDEPCEFEMPSCSSEGHPPNIKPQLKGCNSSNVPTDGVLSVQASKQKGLLNEEQHVIVYAILGFIILILLLVICWLVRSKLSPTDEGANKTKKPLTKNSDGGVRV